MATAVLCARSERFGEDLCHALVRSENVSKRPRQKTVTWPIDQKICEVRHFLADDAPSFLGGAVQECLHCLQGKGISSRETQCSSNFDVCRAKRVRVVHDNVPPGFGSCTEADKSQQPNAELHAGMAVTFPWRQPHEFLLDDSWSWARGADSFEVASQHQRERRVFEAFYPRLMSIPDRPMEPQEPSQEINDALVAEISLVPLEDEEMVNDQESIDTKNGVTTLLMAEMAKADVLVPTSDGLSNALMNQKQQSMISIGDSNIAAAAACMVVKALGESDLVDEKLLLEILKNPSLLTYLMSSDNFVKGKNQDHDKSAPGIKQKATPQIPHNLPADRGACLNQSPVSVLAHWGDSAGNNVGTSISQRLAPTVTSSHMQQSRDCGSVGLDSLLPTGLAKSYSCSASKSSMDILQKGDDCPSREHKQDFDGPKLNACSNSTLSEAPSLHDYRPGDEMGSENNYTSNSSHYFHTQAPSHICSTFRASPTLLPIKDLPSKHPMQEPLKYRSTEASSLLRKTIVYSSTSKAGGRTKRLCVYFNTPRGCRNGDSCAFIHQRINVSSHIISGPRVGER